MLQFGMIYLQIMLTSHANVRVSVIVNNFFFCILLSGILALV